MNKKESYKEKKKTGTITLKNQQSFNNGKKDGDKKSKIIRSKTLKDTSQTPGFFLRETPKLFYPINEEKVITIIIDVLNTLNA